MKCICGETMFDTAGYPGRMYDEPLNQQTRIRRCHCGEKRVTVELDASVLAELRRKAFICDTFDMARKPIKAERKPRDHRKNGWSKKELEILREQFPTMGLDVCKLVNKTKKACECKASRLGLRRIYAHGPRRQHVEQKEPAAAVTYARIPSVFDLASAGGG